MEIKYENSRFLEALVGSRFYISTTFQIFIRDLSDRWWWVDCLLLFYFSSLPHSAIRSPGTSLVYYSLNLSLSLLSVLSSYSLCLSLSDSLSLSLRSFHCLPELRPSLLEIPLCILSPAPQLLSPVKHPGSHTDVTT